jgi:hypothetical protein
VAFNQSVLDPFVSVKSFFFSNIHQHTFSRRLTSNQAETLEMTMALRQEQSCIEPKKSRKNSFLPHLEKLH